jgi:hypothetical protein
MKRANYTGNLLVDSAVADAEQARKSGGHSNAAYEEGTRIRPIDIIRVPKYDRVWQIGAMGQVRKRCSITALGWLFIHHTACSGRCNANRRRIVEMLLVLSCRPRRRSAWTLRDTSGYPFEERKEPGLRLRRVECTVRVCV